MRTFLFAALAALSAVTMTAPAQASGGVFVTYGSGYGGHYDNYRGSQGRGYRDRHYDSRSRQRGYYGYRGDRRYRNYRGYDDYRYRSFRNDDYRRNRDRRYDHDHSDGHDSRRWR